MDGQTPPPAPRATLVVCATCRHKDQGDAEPRAGARMFAALTAGDLPDGLAVRSVECLSVCLDGCTVALQAPGKWTYVYGRLSPESHPADVLRGAALYAAAHDGVVPWRDRPEVFRKQSVARIPPLEQP